MLRQPLDPKQNWTTFIISNLIEKWSEARAAHEFPLPKLVELAPKLGISSGLAAAFGSVFELAEACLGRPIVVDRCCGEQLDAAEQSLIQMLQTASAEGPARMFGQLSSELGEALAVATKSVSLLLAPQQQQFEDLSSTVHAARLSH